MDMNNAKINTLLIHGASEKNNSKKALNSPIYMTSTFTFDSIDDVEKVMSFESDDYVYTRGNNPTLRLFENRMAVLEGGKGAVAFASGMAAISSVLFSLLSPKDNIVINKTIYGSTYTVATKLLPKYNIDYKCIDLSNEENLNNLENLIDENTKVIYFETPCNPTLAIIDIKKVVKIAHKHNIKVVVDNTFASPYLQRPLTQGADIVVHSATKYICGHGDVVAGVAISKDNDYIMKLKFDYMCEFGGVLSPFNAWLLLRGLKTLSVRMREHQKNAMILAEYLEEHPKVKKVYYPGLLSFSGHNLAKEQMDGFGGVLSFELNGSLTDAKKVVDNVKLLKLAVSLGDCESLIELPSAMTHRGYDSEKLKEFGMSESLIRISVGIEDISDIINDLDISLSMI
ncbi:trans-sulfuration enzyme family protein [Helicovermis profundi]|uniref:homocysteine desulfhydrase n=1 Tax=Helicovermis profundi TaxID=3065157 RepID=A0AAU9E6W0_9FIRM|nr:methionine gamma-lyase [Clostridia bacterium S502]